MRLSDGSSALLWEIFRDFASFGRQTGSRFLLLKGGIATGKTLFARAIACFLAGYLDANVSGLSTEEIDGAFQKALEADPRHVELLSMHRGRSYENTVYGFSLRTEGEQLRFDGGKRALLRMAGRAAADKTRQYVWILDDANRVDFSQVLGDLLSALESKDAGNAIHAGGENVTLPENLWFIATFHPTIGETPPDFAWLRRFFVRELVPDAGMICSETDIREGNKLENWTDLAAGQLRREQERALWLEYVYVLYRHIEILMERYFNDRENRLSCKRATPGPGMLLCWNEQQSMTENFTGVNLRIKFQMAPLLRRYLADGLLLPEAEPWVELLQQLWEAASLKEEDLIHDDKVANNAAYKAAYYRIINNLGKVLPRSIFLMLFLQNPLDLRPIPDGEALFLYEDTDHRNDQLHTVKPNLQIQVDSLRLHTPDKLNADTDLSEEYDPRKKLSKRDIQLNPATISATMLKRFLRLELLQGRTKAIADGFEALRKLLDRSAEKKYQELMDPLKNVLDDYFRKTGKGTPRDEKTPGAAT